MLQFDFLNITNIDKTKIMENPFDIIETYKKEVVKSSNFLRHLSEFGRDTKEFRDGELEKKIKLYRSKIDELKSVFAKPDSYLKIINERILNNHSYVKVSINLIDSNILNGEFCKYCGQIKSLSKG